MPVEKFSRVRTVLDSRGTEVPPEVMRTVGVDVETEYAMKASREGADMMYVCMYGRIELGFFFR